MSILNGLNDIHILNIGLNLKYLLPCTFRTENDKLKLHLRKKDEDLLNTKSALERFTSAVNNDVR